MKIEEVLKEITSRQHRLAVLEDVVGYLEEFLPSDTEPEPEEKLLVEEGLCLDPKVSTKAIESVIDDVTKIIGAERKELKKLTSLETKPNGRTTRNTKQARGSNPKPRGRGAKSGTKE